MRPLFALFMRSVREDSRARLPIIFRTALVLVILLTFYANHSTGSRTAPGQELLFMVMLLNCGFIGLTALSIFPSAIAEEKEDETLTLLRMTNLSALAILFGKSSSRLCLALILLAVQVPFTLLCVTLGGVSQADVWLSYAILGATTFFLCNLSLLTSVYCKTTIRAAFLTGILGGILYCALPALYMASVSRRTYMARLGAGSFGPTGLPTPTIWEDIGGWIMDANPMLALSNLFRISPFRAQTAHHIWISLGAGVACFLLSWLIFDRYCSKVGDEVIRPRIKNRQGKVRRLARVPRPGARWPLAWKDFHFMIGGRFGMYLRLALAAIGYFLIYAFARWEMNDRIANYGANFNEYYGEKRMWENVGAASMLGAFWVAVLEIVLVTGRIFGVERRRLTLSSLVGLPWKTGRLIRQKILGCLPLLFPWLLLAAVGAAVFPEPFLRNLPDDFRKINWKEDRDVLCAMLYGGLQVLLFLTTIAWFSLRLRRGALPSAIVILGIWNFIFVMLADEFDHGPNSYLFIMVGVWLTLPALILLARGVYYRLQLVAAED